MSGRHAAEHAPENVMLDPGEVERFYEDCSPLMRALLDELASAPEEPRPFPAIEDALGWPRRRIASVLGGVHRLRTGRFEGRRPYRLHDEGHAASGRWELWVDEGQASTLRRCRLSGASQPGGRS